MREAPCKERLADLPSVSPSAQQVFCELFGGEPATSADLRDRTGLPRRTLYTALRNLRDMGVLRERPSLHDTRQTYFWIDPQLVAAA